MIHSFSSHSENPFMNLSFVSHPPSSSRRAPRGARARIGAFTRLELAAVLVMLFLLGAVVLPGLAQHRAAADRIACLNNLRQVGQAFRQWAEEHDGKTPLWLGWDGRTSPADGGMAGYPPSGPSLWFLMTVISNDLVRPSLLYCPSGIGLEAAEFSSSRNGGFLNPYYRNNAVSYWLGMHNHPDYPQALLAGDFNLQTNGVRRCAVATNVWAATIQAPYADNTRWIGSGDGPPFHGDVGNVLLNDGQARTTSTPQLRELLSRTWDGDGALDFLFPR